MFNIRDSLVIEDLIKNEIKVWMLSKEDEIINTVNCNALRLLDQNSKPLFINGENERDIDE